MYDAHHGDSDPARHQLGERAQLAGLRVEPQIEVEHLANALQLVTKGFGDTIVNRSLAESALCPDTLHCVPFAEPIYETLAFVKRRDHSLSSAAHELARVAFESLIDHRRRGHSSLEILASNRQIVDFLRDPG